jgi:DNA-binding helix-hairpin-helix protein with protein kinase domain
MSRTQRPALNQVEIENMVLDAVEDLERMTDELEDLLADAVRKEAAYRRKESNAFAQATGAAETRRQLAKKESNALRYEWQMAEAVATAHKEAMWTCRHKLEALRSINANVRSQT